MCVCACVCIILFLLLYALIFWRKSRAIALSIWPLVFLSPWYRSSGISRPLTNTISRSIGIHAESRQCRDLKMWIYWDQVFFLYNVTGGGQRLKLGRVLSEPPHHCAAFRGPVLDCSALNLHFSWGFNSTGQKRTNLGVADKESVEFLDECRAWLNGCLKRSSHFLLFSLLLQRSELLREKKNISLN